MNKYIAFMRAINVAGRASVKMNDLRDAFTAAGCRNVRTYIQSGNVIFESPARDAARILRKVRSQLRNVLDDVPDILLRIVGEMEELVRRILSALGMPQSNRVPRSPAGMTQLVENRGGRVSCWGVVIQLGNLRFRETINPDQIVIREAKHGHDLRDITTWCVGQHGKLPVIKFKPGMGDFGSGNSVEVQIDRSAFVGQIESSNNRFGWSMDTDVL